MFISIFKCFRNTLSIFPCRIVFLKRRKFFFVDNVLSPWFMLLQYRNFFILKRILICLLDLVRALHTQLAFHKVCQLTGDRNFCNIRCTEYFIKLYAFVMTCYFKILLWEILVRSRLYYDNSCYYTCHVSSSLSDGKTLSKHQSPSHKRVQR